MILVIDNFDSFTYNLVQYIGEINSDIKIIKNNEYSLSQIIKMDISHIIISPGPGTPDDTGICKEIINYYVDKIPILGVCLGHQLIGGIFGGEIVKADRIIHGKTSNILLKKKSIIFKNLPDEFRATRYHSLLVEGKNFTNITVTSTTDCGEIMSIEHDIYKIYGIQFHPESIQTDYGKEIIKNFLNIV